MDKWKIIVILVLLGSLAGYGMFQQNASNPPPATDPGAKATPQPPANQKIDALKGKTPPAWNIPANRWVNAKAPISLDSLKGSVALLEFWRIGCHHCEATAPFLKTLYQKYQPKGLKMVTIHSPGAPGPDNPENDWDTVRQTIQSWGITYPVAYDEGGMLFKETYGGDTYPVVILLDRTGKVETVITGHDAQKEKQLAAAVEKAMKAK